MKLRAYSTIEIKALDDNNEKRTFSGIASTPSTDRMGDIVEPEGAVFKLPIPFLWQHNAREPIGWITKAKVTSAGIEVEGEVAVIKEAGKLKDRLDEAWQMLKARLVRGLSIGFSAIETADIKGTWGMRFIKWEWLELSAVTIAANSDASISSIKQLDDLILRAASGAPREGVVRLEAKPGASGKQSPKATPKGTDMNLAQQIAQWEAKRTTAQTQAEGLMSKAADEGRTLNAEESTQYDELVKEVDQINQHIQRLKNLEETMVQKATPVIAGTTASGQSAAEIRGGKVITVKSNVIPGAAFTRFAGALVLARGSKLEAAEIAKRWRDSTPEVELALKAAMTAGSTTDADWAAPLVELQTVARDFIDLLRPQTIIGKMTGLRRVPFNVRVASKTQGSTVGWVGQGAPKPVSELKFGEVTLTFAKAAGIVVITEELARFSTPSAEQLVRDDLINTMRQFLDEQFIDPAVAAVANVSPAAITNGVSKVESTGNSLAAITADVESLFTLFIQAGLAPQRGVWVMDGMTALSLSLIRTSQDVYAFPQINLTGGTWFGLPVIVSDSVPRSASGGSIIALVDQSEIMLADEGGVNLDVSREASLQMDSAPSAGAQSLVSLWQNNLVALRAERFMNWRRRRDAAVAYIDKVAY